MKSITGFFIVSSLCIFAAVPALAQVMEPPAPTAVEFSGAMPSANMAVASAPNTMPAAPRFIPVGSWNVEKTAFAQTRGITGVALPCMMANSYDNGFVLRFSGAQGKILAMAIDFRQEAFHQGRKYSVNVSLNQSNIQNVSAMAFSESTLIFNMRSYDGFYQGLQNASTLEMNIEGNAMMFDLGNVAQSLGALESCFGPTGSQLTQAAAKAPNISWGDKPEEVSIKTPTAPIMMWEAKAGDDLQLTLQKWANKAGVPMQWQSDRSASVASDVRLSGSFAEAVQQLMAENAAAMGLEANLAGQSLTPSAPQQITPLLPLSEPLMPKNTDGAKWVAPVGADLQLVLQQWASRADVTLVWQSSVPFKVKQAVQDSGTYESALQSLLNQFGGDRLRPAAQLNNDPATGQKMLFIQSSRVL